MSDNNIRKENVVDLVVAGFQRIHVPERPSDEFFYARLSAKQSATAAAPSRRSPVTTRVFPRSAYRYPLVAAAVLLIAAVGLLTASSGVSRALAQVVASAEKHKFVRFKQVQTTVDKKTTEAGTANSVVYADIAAPRWRVETRYPTDNGEVLIVSVSDSSVKHRHLMTSSQTKKATLFELTGDVTKPILDNIRQFQNKKSVTAEKAKLDGRDAIKYCLNNDKEKTTTTLWVDPQSNLPVRMETVMVDPVPNISVNKFVDTDYEWDPPNANPDQLFNMAVPEGYTVEDKTAPAK